MSHYTLTIPDYQLELSSMSYTNNIELRYNDEVSLIFEKNNCKLFLGNVYKSKDKEFMKQNNIKAIVCVMEEKPKLIDDEDCTDFNFLHIPIPDRSNISIYNYFDQFINFINNQFKNNISVYVHCQMGISRSSTLVIAYLMKEQEMSYNDAMKFVQEKRQQVEPNFGFCCMLMQYENQLK